MRVVDSALPTAPTNRKATIEGSKVQLAWGAANDNVGVSSYAIRRNNVPIGSTTGLAIRMGALRAA